MNAINRDHHFNQYVEAVADHIAMQLTIRSRVVRAVKQLALRQLQETNGRRRR